GTRKPGKVADRRGAGAARARRAFPAARSARPGPVAGGSRLQAGQPHRVLPDRTHDPALRHRHHRPERSPAPL
ncbi:MAG: hypothetical protein AVDCRST_MAG03-1211, partial [uncultured Rubrobacteraceae bacterium]